jgi:hypothetical protein
VKVKTIMTKRRSLLISVFKSTFPSMALASCDFHCKSCLRKRIVLDGLMKLYNKDSDFQMIIRLIWALAYMSQDMVTTVWEINIQETVR